MTVLEYVSLSVMIVGAAFVAVDAVFLAIFIVVYAIVTAGAALKRKLRRNNN